MKVTIMKIKAIAFFFSMAMLFSSCITTDDYADDPKGNFEALWHAIDEHYCFFKEKNVDWNDVYRRYAPQVDAGMNVAQQFEVYTNMLSELKDGHVNLFTSFDVGRNWHFHEDFPSNVSDTLLRKYLGTDYRIATGMQYRRLDDNMGYVRCASFANELGAGNLDDILTYLAPCNGLIIDVRDNGGGLMSAAKELAARFTNDETLVGYMQHKTGKGHEAFSPMEKQTVKPSRGVRWQKRVVVLTNRSVYSAANEFVKYMKCFPRVKVVGDYTGGGAGMPFSSELPNGWTIRFSACPMFDAEKNSTEFGIAPDHKVGLSQADLLAGQDTIIEFARQLLRQGW